MGIYNLRMSSAKNRSVIEKFSYIVREGKYSHSVNEKYEDFLYAEHINLPKFARDSAMRFWKHVESYERINANLFREIEFSIPHELNDEERIEVATEFAKKVFKDEYVYSLAIHNKKSSSNKEIDNVHCHIIFSERKLDGIERNRVQFFRNYNSRNPVSGGCKKVDWSRKAKLYEVREEWERTANSYLKKYNTEITCKSLKAQRLNAIMQNDFLKAECLDRKAVHIDLQLLRYCNNSEVRELNIKHFETCKKIKEYKEKLYKLRVQNFEEENEKARQRFLNNEREEIDFSHFELSNFDENKYNNVKENVNLFIDNKVEIVENENKIEELNSMTDIEIEEKALNILTQNTYFDKLNRLNELEFIYDKTPYKENYAFKKEKSELEEYFSNLRNDKLFKINLNKVKEEIINENNLQIQSLNNKNLELKSNQLILEDNIESKKVLSECLDTLISDYTKLEDIKKQIFDFRNSEFDEEKILFEVYKNMNRADLIDKYKELKDWKEQVDENNVELQNKISILEGSFAKFNYKNDVTSQVQFILEEKEKIYEDLRHQETVLENKLKITNEFLTQNSELISEQFNEKHKEIIEDFNFENIFKTSIDINILIENKESRLKQIMTINEDEINSRAYNILTKNEYSKNLKELEKLNFIYDKTPNKEFFAFKERKAQLEEYFDKLNKNEFFQNKLSNMKESIREKYQKEIDELGVELKELRNSEFKDFYKESNEESFILSKNLVRETYNNLHELYDKSREIDKKVKNYKRLLDKEEILFDIYREIEREDVIVKYRELKDWKEQLNKITDESAKEELQRKISNLEGSFAKFNYNNNITSKVDEILAERRAKYKALRQEQDDIKGRIKYSKDFIEKLKEKQKDSLIYENNLLKDEFNQIKALDEKENISSIEKLYNKLVYNCKVEENSTLISEKINVNTEFSDNKFEFTLNESEKREIRQMLIDNINKLVEENKIIQENTNLKLLEDDKELMKFILDKKTNNQYSLELSRLKLYEEKLNKNIDVSYFNNAIKETKERINLLLKNTQVTDEEKNRTRAIIRSNSMNNIVKLHNNKKKIRVLYASLKELSSSKDIKLSSLFANNNKDNSMPEKYNYDKKLYVLGVDRIVVEEEDVVEKERRRIAWENSR